MKTLSIFGKERVSTIFVGRSIQDLSSLLNNAQSVIITDSIVRRQYGHLFPPEIPVLEISTGEKSKTLETVSLLYEAFLKLELDRSSFVVGFGGGIVCDIAGFCAATYMRGIEFGFVPTTLLAQVDASVGGKNGVNFNGYKNIIGTFEQPRFVICDPTVLMSLPNDIFRCGMAEIIKIALVRDETFFQWLESHMDELVARNPEILEEAICESLRLKADVVMEDETEKGIRRLLNFGHTFGHSIEAYTGTAHGDAVSIGMAIAGKISVKLGYFSADELDRMLMMLKKAGLPVEISKEQISQLPALMWKDKKKEANAIHVVLVEKNGVGKAVLMPFEQLEEVLYAVC